MNCIIVEDDIIALKVLQQMVKQTVGLKLMESFTSSIDGYNYLSRNSIDLIFIDIELPEMSGIELLNTLHQQPLVIFTTSKKEYAIDVFQFNVIDYLVKPINYPGFIKAITKAQRVFFSLNPTQLQVADVTEKYGEDLIGVPPVEFLFVKSGGIYFNVSFDNIFYIEALGDYLNIHTKERKITHHETLKGIESKLPSHFLRVHRSYIVNLTKIKSIEDSSISIDGSIVPIGVSFRPEVYKRLKLGKD